MGASFGCLVPRLVTGQFDPTRHKAVWPSTGNYCRGGAYNAQLLGCESVAILPEGMSKERFDWLRTVAGEIIATPGTEAEEHGSCTGERSPMSADYSQSPYNDNGGRPRQYDVEPWRKWAYYGGGALQVLGVLAFIAVFLTMFMSFGFIGHHPGAISAHVHS